MILYFLMIPIVFLHINDYILTEISVLISTPASKISHTKSVPAVARKNEKGKCKCSICPTKLASVSVTLCFFKQLYTYILRSVLLTGFCKQNFLCWYITEMSHLKKPQQGVLLLLLPTPNPGAQFNELPRVCHTFVLTPAPRNLTLGHSCRAAPHLALSY